VLDVLKDGVDSYYLWLGSLGCNINSLGRRICMSSRYYVLFSLHSTHLVLPRFTKKKSYVYKTINRERGNSCFPKVKETIIFYFLFLVLYFFVYFFLHLIFLSLPTPVPFASATRRSPTFKV